MQMNIDDIKISDQFLDSHPSQEKMERFEKYWLRTNHQDKPIILDKNGYLVDGYIRYLIMKRNEIQTKMETRRASQTFLPTVSQVQREAAFE